MGNHGNQDDLSAAMALMEQQMLQIQQTMQAREQAAQQAAEHAAEQQQQRICTIENMASRSANKNPETDHSLKVNSVDTTKIDELLAKVDQLIMSNQNQVFIMEESSSKHNAKDTAPDTDKPAEDQQEAKNTGYQKSYPQNFPGRTFVLSNSWNKRHNLKPQNNQQTALSITTAPHDELKSLAMMLQQLLQGKHVQCKALNQVTTYINARMNNMFNDMSTKYDNIASHMRQMDIQIAQIAESVRTQKGSPPSKTKTNPKECNAVALRSGRQFTEPTPKLHRGRKGKA
ncbi:hypothetical protein DY000_02039962 [Brassica cretica]|uniref:Uncharacterized protein n=1 Tax=Brassica cretica TaxID=69181 RepID=A0ABQ7B4D2_BRACR|nr:hypothetical protein DY000_02039962 [Brassica cretica]